MTTDFLSSVLAPDLQQDGAAVSPRRKTINFVGATVADDPDNFKTTVTIGSAVDRFVSARLVASSALPANSRTGNTLTASGFGALSIDGVAVLDNDVVLVAAEGGGAHAHNGVYTVVQAGSGGTPFILTRDTDFDEAAEIPAGLRVFVSAGSANAGTEWVLVTTGVITVNTTALEFATPVAGTSVNLPSDPGDDGKVAVADSGNLTYVTAAQLVDIIETADGSGSGLDADLVRGTTPGTTGLALLDDTTAAAARTTISVGWGLFEAETEALIYTMTARPPSPMVAAIETLILELKATGWWDEIGYLIVPTLHTEQASLLDWKDPTRTAVNVGCAFTAYQGFVGDGVGDYINTIAPTSVTGYALNTVNQLVWTEDQTNDNNTVSCVGSRELTISPRSSGGNLSARSNISSAVNLGATANKFGLYQTRRTVNGSFSGYKNGVLNGTSATAATSTQTEVVTLFNDNGGFADGRVLAYGIGGTSAADPALLYSALDAFYDALGTVHT